MSESHSSSMTVGVVVEVLEQVAPLALSESWDNTGLLLGDPLRPVNRIMTCLTLTGDSVAEAIEERAELVISHHPLPFKPLAKITTATSTGKLVWQLASSGISVYSPHTAWDSAMDGINAQLARKLSIHETESLIASQSHELGAGRCGTLPRPSSIEKIAAKLAASIPACRPRAVFIDRPIERVAFGCGSGGSFLSAAADKACDLLITGEATFHTCLEAQSLGVGLLMIGHFASEKFAMDQLADRLAIAFPGLSIWGSRREADPVRNITLA